MITRESDVRWYQAPRGNEPEPKDAVYTHVFNHVRAVEEDQVDIHKMNLLNARLYSNREPMFFDWSSNFGFRHKPISFNNENVIQSVVDTLRANISKNQVKATVFPTDASFSIYKKTKQLDRYLYSEFLHLNVYSIGQEVFKDCLVYQVAAIHIDINRVTNQIEMERVHPDEIVVDQRECTSRKQPSSMFRRKLVDRQELLDAWTANVTDKKRKAELTEIIENAQGDDFVWTTHRSPSSPDLLVLIEGWKLGKDGRHVIALENGVLLDEEYTRDKFPIITLKFEEAETGFYGRSLVESLVGYQIRLNHINSVIERCQNLMSFPRLFFTAGNEISSFEIDDTIGAQYYLRGNQPPQVEIWPAVHAEIYRERDRERANAFEFAGISQLSAQSKLPSQTRLDSSEALREVSNIENQRFSLIAQKYEGLYLELAEHIVELSAILYKKRNVSRKSSFNLNNLINTIEWKDIDLERDRFVMQLGASSVVNMTPAGRKDIASDWAQRGWVRDQNQIAELVGHPDLEHLMSVRRASRDVIYYKLDLLLQGKEAHPEETDDLMLSQQMVTDELNIIKQFEDVPDEVLDNFDIYLQEIEAKLNPEQPIQMQGGPSMAPGPIQGQVEASIPDINQLNRSNI